MVIIPGRGTSQGTIVLLSVLCSCRAASRSGRSSTVSLTLAFNKRGSALFWPPRASELANLELASRGSPPWTNTPCKPIPGNAYGAR